MPKLHLEVLAPEARALWPLLSTCASGYYLAGGTALALQLGHRKSLDFDFFSEKPVPRTQLSKTEKAFEGREITPQVNNQDELTVLVDGIKISFISYPFPLLMPLLREDGLDLLQPPEIAVTKAYTIGRRGEWKDYIDLHACLTRGITTLAEIIQNAQKKYGAAFSDRLFLEQLVYFEDMDDSQKLEMDAEPLREEVRKFFEKAIADLRLAG
jgi:hypothetical protein